MKRTLLVIGFIVAGCIAVGSASAATPEAPAAAPAVEKAPAVTPSLDPFQGGILETFVPEAKNCQDYGQCQNQIPPGEPCDTPAGCVCRWSSFSWKCGRL